MSLKRCENMVMLLPHLSSIVLLALIVTFVYLTRNEVHLDPHVFVQQGQISGSDQNNLIPRCNLFSGRWIYDNVSSPLYKEKQCSLRGLINHDFACEHFGRKDLKYQNWRWQPHNCNIPRFNGTALLEKLRGKKLLFVGDSLNRNQWKSMLCLIDSSFPAPSKNRLTQTGSLYQLQFIEYNTTIGFHWAPLLVESNCDPITPKAWPRIVRIKSIEKHGRHWIDADILVFNSFAWWMNYQTTVLWGSFDSPDATYNVVENRRRVYEMALNTWSDWLEMHINRTKTKVFFRSPTPFRLGDIRLGKDHSCYNITEPISNETSYWASTMNRDMMRIAESTVDKLEQRGLKVEYLNITELSAYRADAHPTIYKDFSRTLSKGQRIDPMKHSDCLHWCLSGVPDVWNQILYAYIMKS